MTRRRPASLTVLAVFHFIFGGLGLLCSLVNVATTAMGAGRLRQANAANAPQQKEMMETQKRFEDRMEQEVPFQRERKAIAPVVSILLCVLLVVGGIGLWNVNGWARPVNILYAVLSLLFSTVSLVYLLVYEWPLLTQMVENEQGQGQEMQMVKSVMQVAIYVAAGLALVAMLYPLITLGVMLLPSTGRALREGGSGEDGDEGYPDGLDRPDYDVGRWRDRGEPSGGGYTSR